VSRYDEQRHISGRLIFGEANPKQRIPLSFLARKHLSAHNAQRNIRFYTMFILDLELHFFIVGAARINCYSRNEEVFLVQLAAQQLFSPWEQSMMHDQRRLLSLVCCVSEGDFLLFVNKSIDCILWWTSLDR